MDEQSTIEPGAAGAPEGAVSEPTADEIKQLYEATGVKAPVPTGKSKGRPKTTNVRAKDDAKKPAGDSDAGEQGDKDDKSKSKNAPASDKDGDSGDNSDQKSKKVSKDSGKVPEESEEASEGVHDAKSRDEKDSKPGGEKDSDGGTDGTGQTEDKSDDTTEDEQDAEGKRPGKSNPAVEARIQKLANEKRAAEERANELEKQLQEKEQAVQQSKIAQEDPEYEIEDFHKVRDNEGNIVDLDPEQAELAWRRWKDGYDQRAEERQAKANQESARAEYQAKIERQVMEQSVKAYDTLASLMDEYPELVSTSNKFDEDFASEAMPIIEESIDYAEGTEPGNPNGNQPVIIGLKLHPKKILDALRNISTKKRSLPLNGVNDNVETRSNVNVPHTRSSDPTINQANELYKELGIKKRI